MSDSILAKRKRIDEIYQSYLSKLLSLQKQQNEILREFARALEQKKIDQTREKISRIIDITPHLAVSHIRRRGVAYIFI